MTQREKEERKQTKKSIEEKKTYQKRGKDGMDIKEIEIVVREVKKKGTA